MGALGTAGVGTRGTHREKPKREGFSQNQSLPGAWQCWHLVRSLDEGCLVRPRVPAGSTDSCLSAGEQGFLL